MNTPYCTRHVSHRTLHTVQLTVHEMNTHQQTVRVSLQTTTSIDPCRHRGCTVTFVPAHIRPGFMVCSRQQDLDNPLAQLSTSSRISPAKLFFSGGAGGGAAGSAKDWTQGERNYTRSFRVLRPIQTKPLFLVAGSVDFSTICIFRWREGGK